MKLLIQIPCLNEADTLHRVLEDLPDSLSGIDCIEILIIDDGSTDATTATALGLGAHHVVRHRRNRGLAAAFSTGLETSLNLGADIIVNTDGDHQYPGRSINDLIQPILAGRADIVIGDRRPEQDLRQPRFKRWLYTLGRRVVSWMAGQNLPDPVSGFRAFSREAAQKLHVVTNYSYTIETLVQAVERGLAIEFVPIETNLPTRPSRLFRSHSQFVARSSATLLRVFFMYHPLQSLIWVSVALGVIGMMPIVRFVIFYMLGQGDGHVQSLILGAAIVIASGLVLAAGLIADLVSHNRRLMESMVERRRSSAAERIVGERSFAGQSASQQSVANPQEVDPSNTELGRSEDKNRFPASSRRRSGRAALLLLAALSLTNATAIGCGSRMATNSIHDIPSTGQRSTANDIDAGIVFVDEPKTLCYPLEQFAIAEDLQVTSIESSCECVEAEIINYQNARRSTRRALRFVIHEEPDAESLASLRIRFALICSDGTERLVHLSFNQARLVH